MRHVTKAAASEPMELPLGGARVPPADSDRAERLVWMLLTLARKREFAPAAYHDRFGGSAKTLSRDLARLRELGDAHGFEIVRPRKRPIAAVRIDGIAAVSQGRADAARDVLVAMADALGDVVSQSLAGYLDVSDRGDRFLRVATPRLIEHSAIAVTYRALRAAWSRRARVRFRYLKPEASQSVERTVEPYLVAYYSGRYYLVGFDVKPGGGWRQFALDRIRGSAALAGTFTRRPIPERYRGEDAIGLFKGERASEIAVRLSPVIAQAVAAREWKRNQRVTFASDGSATIAFEVFDLAEGVRWALGFGSEACVVAPPAAVGLARVLLAQMLRPYEARSAKTA